MVLIAGYSDIVEGYARDYIIEKMYNFADLVLNNPSSPRGQNTFTVGSLFYPPQVAWLADNGPYPSENYVDNKEKIDWINQEIKKLNTANNIRFPPCFHTYGVRTQTRKRIDRYGQITMRSVKSHRWELWLETEPENMLHLTIEKRFKMGQALNNYFKYNVPETST